MNVEVFTFAFMILTLKKYYPYLLIFLISTFVFSLFIGNAHLFDWDEANFAEAAREMLLTKNVMQVQIDFQPFWEKPPMFIWLQALSMSVWGIHEFGARFPNAIIGAATLCVLFFAGQKLATKKMAWLWIIIYAGSWLPHFYFKTAIIDPLFNLFIFLTFLQFHFAFSTQKNKHYVFSGLFLGLAVLTKGPVAIMLSGLGALLYLVIFKQWKQIKWSGVLYLSLVCFFTIFLWFGIDIIQNGWWFTQTFLEYQIRLLTTQDAGHGGPFYYHFVVLLLGCFPSSVLLFQYTRNKAKRNLEFKNMNLDFGKWMQLLFWITLIVFSIVKTKIIHYSSLCYFPLSYFAARELYLILYEQKPWKKITLVLFFIIGFLIASFVMLVPVLAQHLEWIKPLLEDPFAVANLDAAVQWHNVEMIFGILIFVAFLLAFVFILKGKSKAFVAFLLVQVVFLELVVMHFTPKIEEITQGAAVRFYQSVKGKDAIIYTSHFKSYAYLFYSQKPAPIAGIPLPTFDNVLNGKVKKELFFVTKITSQASFMEYYPQAQLLKNENGYLLYKIPQHQ